MTDEITLPVNQDQWEKNSSKFPATGNHDVEITECGWETKGKSIKFMVEIIGDDPDAGKADKIVGGATEGKTWKTREILDNLGVSYKFGDSGLSFKPSDVEGKKAVGVWTEETGKKGGVGEEVKYPKLTSILPEGTAIES